MEDERRERQLYAARTMMPLALAAISDYCQGVCTELKRILGGKRPPKDPEQLTSPEDMKLPLISDLRLEAVEQVLQFADRSVQDRVGEMLKLLQVQQSRATNRSGHIIDNTMFARWYYTLISDALELSARANNLFPYARGDTDNAPAPPSQPEMFRSAGWYGFMRPDWVELQKHIAEDWQPYSSQ